MSDVCRLSIAATGCFNHPLGDQTPIDCRYGEEIASLDLPHRQIVIVTEAKTLSYGALVNPRAVIVWNVSGEGIQFQPTVEEAAQIARKVLEVGLVSGDSDEASVQGWQSIRPAKPGHGRGGSTILWLAHGTRVVLRPEQPGATVSVRVLVVPGQ